MTNDSYLDLVSDAASLAAFKRGETTDALLSEESMAENACLIDFKSYAQEYPDKLFPLLAKLRPEFQELFIEFHLLEKSQYFIGPAHGQVQTRVWQALRIIEQAIGSLIILGEKPDLPTILPILTAAGLDETAYGSLSQMIVEYAQTQSYGLVAASRNAPVPAIRKIFRPAIEKMLASKDIKVVAVGSYLRSLTHQASLTEDGLSKRCIARTKRVKTLRFSAPSAQESPVISFGAVAKLQATPWSMFEVNSEQQISRLWQSLKTQGKRFFGKHTAQIFAPLGSDRKLKFGYIFARTSPPSLVRSMLNIRGIAEMVSTSSNDDATMITVPDADVQDLIRQQMATVQPEIHEGNFVRILTGEAARYCGIVTQEYSSTVRVVVNFPTGRTFIVTADKSAVEVISKTKTTACTFWGLNSATSVH